MKVLILVKRFPPEAPGTAVLGQELAAELARTGHEVTVVAGYPHHPYGRLFPGYRQRLLDITQENGYRLVRTAHVVHPSGALPVRSLVMASQCAGALLTLGYLERPDVVMSFDGYPLLGPLTAALLARVWRARCVAVIYDLYPDIAVELGQLTHPGLIAWAQKLEAMSYRYADRIVVLSEGFRRTLIGRKGVPAAKIAVIPVWLDAHEITPGSRDNAWRRRQGIPAEKFIVLYAGTIGLVSGAEVVAAAAQQLRDHTDIIFLMVGDGYGKEQVLQQARSRGLTNILFLPFQPREYLPEVQATADVSVVTLAPGRGRTSVPSKVLAYMAAARPVVAAVDEDCDTAQLIRQACCGLVVPPADGQALAEAIRAYYENPNLRRAAGEAGRAYFLQHCEKMSVLRQYAELLQELPAARG